MLEDMANLLLRSRSSTISDPPPKVGENQFTGFFKRHKTLAARLSREQDYERARSEYPKVILPWFKLFENTIQKYGITSEDIYNFDKSGYAIGINSIQIIITSAKYHGRRVILQPGNGECVSAIEYIGACGVALLPYIIFKGKVFLELWL